jgi:HlyD family secretion protein
MVLVGIGTLHLAACARQEAAEVGPVAPVARTRIERIVVATGTIEPEKEVEVRPRISGIVERVHVAAGDVVSAGQLLVEIDRELLEAQAAEARSRLQRSQVEQRYAKLEMERSATLRRGGTVAPQENERAEARYKRSEAAVARDAAAREYLEVQLRQTHVTAPMAGTILDVDVEEGDAVSDVTAVTGGTRLLTLAADDVLHLKGLVDENEIVRVAVGQPARIRTEAYGDRVFGGRVREIKPVGERQQNVTYFEVEVLVVDPDAKLLRPKMSADADIVSEVVDAAVVVPETALLYEGDDVYVETVGASTSSARERRQVTIGIVDGDRVQIVAGLEPGEQVRLR